MVVVLDALDAQVVVVVQMDVEDVTVHVLVVTQDVVQIVVQDAIRIALDALALAPHLVLVAVDAPVLAVPTALLTAEILVLHNVSEQHLHPCIVIYNFYIKSVLLLTIP